MPLSWEAGGPGETRGSSTSTFIGTDSPGNGLLLNTMDNAAFERDASGGEVPRRHGVVTTTVELGEFAASRTGQPLAPLCKPDLCRAMMPLHAAVKTPAMRPNPWHRYKTVFLVVTVVGLVIWALAYVGLVYAKVL